MNAPAIVKAASADGLDAPPLSAAAEGDDTREAFRAAMRDLAGGVTIVTTGSGDMLRGLTATSVSSLSMDPPSLLVCINRGSSTLSVLRQYRCFAVNLLAADQRRIADQFAGRTSLRGAMQYAGADWTTAATGAPLFADALAAVDCSVEKLVDWHSHVVVFGQVRAVRRKSGVSALVYWRGDYGAIDEAHRSIG